MPTPSGLSGGLTGVKIWKAHAESVGRAEDVLVTLLVPFCVAFSVGLLEPNLCPIDRWEEIASIAERCRLDGRTRGETILTIVRWAKAQEPPVLFTPEQDKCWRRVIGGRISEHRRREAAKQAALEEKRKRAAAAQQEKLAGERREHNETVWAKSGGGVAVLRRYLTAATALDRLKVCYLGSVSQGRFFGAYVRYAPVVPSDISQVDRKTFEVLGTQRDGRTVRNRYYLVIADDQVLVDWPRSVGFNEPSLAFFAADADHELIRFWVHVKVGDYYNYEFDSRTHWQDFSLFTRPDTRPMWHGYIPRQDPSCRQLVEYLGSERKPITARLSRAGRGADQFIILGWEPNFVPLEHHRTGP